MRSELISEYGRIARSFVAESAHVIAGGLMIFLVFLVLYSLIEWCDEQ